MKTLIATILAITVFNSFAATVPVYTTVVDEIRYVDGTFGINEEMGRAWVNLTIEYYNAAHDIYPTLEKVKVPGLLLVDESVVLEVEGQQIECAKIRPTRLFGNRRAKATGNCKIKSSIVKETRDNGFETYKVNVLKVTLETK